MAVWSIIKKSELEGAKRIDSEYYRRDFIEAENILKKINLIKLNPKNAFITDGQHGYFKLDPKSEIRQITAQHIKDGFIHKESADRLSSDTHKKNLRASLQFEDVVLSTVGSVGNAGIVTKDIPPANLDQNVARIHLKIKNLDPYFLTVFFLSKYGKSQIQRNITGQVQQRLSLGAVRELDVPLLKDQKTISYLLKQCHYMFILSKKFYSKAEQILLEELGLKDLDLKDDLFYTTMLKEVKDNNRMDTEYYMPKYEKLMEHIFNFEHIPLGKLAKFKKGVEPGSDKYFKTGKPFLRVSNLSKFEIINNNQKYLKNNLYMQLKKSYEPKKGEILLSKDATPGVAYVLKESIEGIISSGILRLEVALSIKNEYLALVINSQVGQMQMKRDSSGSIINHWKIDQIKNLEIPLLTHDTQKKIENLCCESFLKRKEAKQLLEQAKHKVEEMIEKEAGVK